MLSGKLKSGNFTEESHLVENMCPQSPQKTSLIKKKVSKKQILVD